MSTETDQNPADAPAGWAGAELRMTDPRSLLLDRNPRQVGDIATTRPELVHSIRTHGVLQPVLVERDAHEADEALHVRDGHSRVLAAITAGLDEVPVILAAHLDDDHKRRVAEQYISNELRQGFDPRETGAVFHELSLFGLSAADLASQLSTTRETVESGLAVHRSTAARDALATHPSLDLMQAAQLASFESAGDTEAIAELTGCLAGDEPEDFDHLAAHIRHHRERERAIAETTEALRTSGMRVFESSSEAHAAGAVPISGLRAGRTDQTRLDADPEAHVSCPGHAALVVARCDGTVTPQYVCCDPKGNGHVDVWAGHGAGTGTGASKSDFERAQLRRTKANNEAWRAAEEVRRRWLAQLCQRTSPPRKATIFIAECLARGDHELSRALSEGCYDHTPACELLGIHAKPGTDDPLSRGWSRLSANQSIQRCLAIILAAFEAATSVESWRRPTPGVKRYFEQIIRTWGYHPSLVEKLVNSPDADADQWDHLATDQTDADEATPAADRGEDPEAAGDAGTVEVPGAVILDDVPGEDQDDEETVLGRDERGGSAATVPVCRDEALETVASAGWSVTTVHLPGDEPDAPAVPGEDPVTHLDEDDADDPDDGWFANEANTEAAEDGGQAARSEVA
jgi:ParB family chromosome partitioning protein